MILWDRLISVVENMIKKDRQELHTFALGKIESFDPIKMRAEVYLLENIRHDNKFYQSQTIVDCLVKFPKTESFYIRIPYKKGDKVAVAFCESNMADIIITGDRTNQNMTRRHSEDDLVVIGGWISGGENTVGSNANDIVIVNSKHNSMITFTEDNNLILTNIKDIQAQCETATIDANNTTINSETTINGKTTINGSLDVSGIIKAPTVNAGSSLTVAGKEQKGHTHTTTKEGQPTSPPN